MSGKKRGHGRDEPAAKRVVIEGMDRIAIALEKIGTELKQLNNHDVNCYPPSNLAVIAAELAKLDSGNIKGPYASSLTIIAHHLEKLTGESGDGGITGAIDSLSGEVGNGAANIVEAIKMSGKKIAENLDEIDTTVHHGIEDVVQEIEYAVEKIGEKKPADGSDDS